MSHANPGSISVLSTHYLTDYPVLLMSVLQSHRKSLSPTQHPPLDFHYLARPRRRSGLLSARQVAGLPDLHGEQTGRSWVVLRRRGWGEDHVRALPLPAIVSQMHDGPSC